MLNKTEQTYEDEGIDIRSECLLIKDPTDDKILKIPFNVEVFGMNRDCVDLLIMTEFGYTKVDLTHEEKINLGNKIHCALLEAHNYTVLTQFTCDELFEEED